MADLPTGSVRRSPALSRRIALAQLALFWEDVLQRLWRVVSLAGLALGLSLMGLWTWLPGWLHLGLLAVLVAAFAILLRRDFRGLAWPAEAAALRRLELKSGFDHRPLLAVEDDYAGDRRDRHSIALFEAHRRRMAALARAVRVGRPLSRVAETDRFALRAFAALVLVAGAMAGWSDARANMVAVFDPDFSRSLAGPGATGEVTLWITPPAYTGVPPIWLDADRAAEVDRPLAVPAGSELVAQLRGGDGAPFVAVDDEAFAFEPAGPGSWQISHLLESGTRLAIVQSGNELAAWPIDVIADLPPEVALTEPPRETLRNGLRLDVEASDDYGLDRIVGTIRLVEHPDERPLEIAVPLPHTGVTRMQGPSFYNFLAHPWAGRSVELRLTATDVVGQTGSTEPVVFKMPERYFYHPVARELARLRKELALDPSIASQVAAAMAGLAQDPEAYLDDFGVHLAIVAGFKRLLLDRSEAGRTAVMDLMWDTALAIEEGPLAFAERRVRDIQQRLLEALTEGASEQEIERLIDELRLAMEDYMRALSNRLRSDPGELFDPTDALKAVGSRELTDLVEQIRDLLRAGSRDAAQTLLNRLQEIMENISVGNLSDLTGAMTAQAAEILQTVRQLMAGQQELLDRTFRMLRDDTAEAESGGAALDQDRLGQVLREMMGRMEEFGFGGSREFERAERSMDRAARQLEAGRPGPAVDHQTAAIDRLRAGADALMQQLIEQAGEAASAEGTGFFGAPRDPMGRQLGGVTGQDLGDVRIPEHGAIIRAREILEELYKRAGEQHRPSEEQDYLRRLLRRF